MTRQPSRRAAGSSPPPTRGDRPYPEIPPGRLALRARHWANTIRDLGSAADELSALLERNPWLWAPIWFVSCLVVATCWTTLIPELLAPRLGATAVAKWGIGISTFGERFSVTAALSVPTVAAFRLIKRVTFTKRAG